MSAMKRLPSVDVVIIGGGWSGLLMAKELGARTALSVVVLERGHKARTLAELAEGMDELDYFSRTRAQQDCSQETVTFRRAPGEDALPIRQLVNFLPGTGIGGSGEHWGAAYPRLQPDIFELYSKTVERYGARKLPENHAIQDWGITWAEIEPYYARMEKVIGISGKAGNLAGKKIEGGDPFEGPRSTEYPMPPGKTSYICTLFQDAAGRLGYHPFPHASAINTVTFKNSDGVVRPACFYCGFCGVYGCMVGAKAQPSNLLIPIVRKQKGVTIRTGSTVRRILRDASAKNGKVRGVTYIDGAGEEVFQPADLVFLASWTFNNTRLLLLSGLGDPYDPAAGTGTLGRNLTHQVQTGARSFFEKPLNRFMGVGQPGFVSATSKATFSTIATCRSCEGERSQRQLAVLNRSQRFERSRPPLRSAGDRNGRRLRLNIMTGWRASALRASTSPTERTSWISTRFIKIAEASVHPPGDASAKEHCEGGDETQAGGSVVLDVAKRVGFEPAFEKVQKT